MEDRRPEALAKERAWERGTEVKNQPFFGYPFPKRRSRKHTSGHKESPWTFLWTQLRDLKVLSPRLGEKLRGELGGLTSRGQAVWALWGKGRAHCPQLLQPGAPLTEAVRKREGT